MLSWAVTFFVIATIAAIPGFGGMAGPAGQHLDSILARMHVVHVNNN